MRPALPEFDAVVRLAEAEPRPVGVFAITTAEQQVPRAQVLDPALDPAPDAPYVLGHPSFVLRWADGRLLLVAPDRLQKLDLRAADALRGLVSMGKTPLAPGQPQDAWHCEGCGESIEGQFRQCWNCGRDAPVTGD